MAAAKKYSKELRCHFSKGSMLRNLSPDFFYQGSLNKFTPFIKMSHSFIHSMVVLLFPPFHHSIFEHRFANIYSIYSRFVFPIHSALGRPLISFTAKSMEEVLLSIRWNKIDLNRRLSTNTYLYKIQNTVRMFPGPGWTVPDWGRSTQTGKKCK